MILGIGNDLIELERIRNAVERFGERFLYRCFTRRELEFCRSFSDPIPHLAARFAAKEAGAKALGTGIARGILWREIEVLRRRGHRPTLHLHGRAWGRAEAMGAERAHVTLTHSRTMAEAVVLVEGFGELRSSET